jgi:ribosomal-protein-alanine N-acetyltransferase
MSSVAQDRLDSIMAVMEMAFDPAFGEAWTRRQVSEALAMRGTHCLLAGPDGLEPSPGAEVAGFALSRNVLDEEELLLLAVTPALRGRGIGQRLLGRFVEAAKARGATRLFLEMREGNKAESLYRAAGFVNVGHRRHYYRRGHGAPMDAITFGLSC